MIGLKRCTIGVLAVLLIVLVTFWLAVSRIGSPLILNYAVKQVPGLSVADIEGGLSSTLILKQLQYQADGLDTTVAQLDLNLRWRCVFQIAICLEHVHMHDIDVQLSETQSTPEAESSEPEIIRLPFLVVVEELLVTDTDVLLADQTRVYLDELRSRLRLYKTFQFIEPQLIRFGLIPAPSLKTQPQPTSPQSVVLPDVFIPIDLVVQNFELQDAFFARQKIDSLQIDLRATASDLSISRLKLSSELGSIDLSGDIALQDEYPLSFQSSITALLEPEVNVEVAINLQDSLQSLEVQAFVQQPISANLRARLKPLEPKIPMQARIDWQAFDHSKLGESSPQFNVAAGHLELNGDMTDYAVKLNTAFTVPQLPTTTEIAFTGLLNPTRAIIENLILDTLSGSIGTQGRVSFADDIDWSLTTQVNNIDFSLIDAQLPSEITGELVYQGVIADQQLSLNVSTLAIDSVQQGYPLQLSGSAALSQRSKFAVGNLRLAHVNNSLQGFVRVLLDQRIDADVIVAFTELSDSYAGVSGSIRGNILASGAITNPQIDANLTGTDIALNKFDANTDEPIEIARQLALQIGGDVTRPQLTFVIEHSWAQIDALLNIDRSQPTWLIEAERFSLLSQQQNLTLENTGSIAIDFADLKVEAQPLCWTNGKDGNLCLDQLSHSSEITEFAVSIDQFAIRDILALNPSTAPINTLDAQLQSEITGSWKPSSGLTAHANMAITPANWRIGDDNKHIDIYTTQTTGTASFANQKLSADLLVSGPQIGELDVRSTLLLKDETSLLDSTVTARRLDLSPVTFLSPEFHQLQGLIDANLRVEGDPKSPSVTGELQLENGIVDIYRAPAVISDWQTKLKFSGQQADIATTFKLGDGAGEIDGSFGWQDYFWLTASVFGDGLSVKHQDIKIALSPNMDISYTPQQTKVTGELTIPSSHIKIDTLPENAIAPSGDVIMRGEPESESVIDTALLDLQVFIDPEELSAVRLEAFGLEANLTGDLKLANQPTLSAYGDLQIVGGEYRAYGQELLISTGELQFNGPLSQPLLFIEAIRDPVLTEDGVTAGVRIDGVASQPNIELFSEPSLDQAQALAYLLFGSNTLSGDQTGEQDYISLLYGLGVSNSGGVTSSLGEALGIDNLRLQTKRQGDDTSVSVSGQLSDSLTVEYVFNAESEVTLRYQILPRLFIEASKGFYESILLYYRFSAGHVGNQPETATD